MSKEITPTIKPLKTIEYTCQQSRYEHVAKLPMRGLMLAPSGSGKTVLISNLILDIYKNCFKRIYIFSPSIHIDKIWAPVMRYCKNELGQIESKHEQFYFDSYNPEDLSNIIHTQYNVVEWMKDNNYKDIYQILVVVDDMADDPSFTRQSKLLHSLYIRGRHLFISSITASQSYKAIAPVIRKNLSCFFVFRLRNQSDLDAFLEEFSAVYNKEILLEFYYKAIEQPYSFLFVDLLQHDKKKMFYINFDQVLTIEN